MGMTSEREGLGSGGGLRRPVVAENDGETERFRPEDHCSKSGQAPIRDAHKPDFMLATRADRFHIQA
jgi:hypothetical protein